MSACQEPIFPLVFGHSNVFYLAGFNLDDYGNFLVAGNAIDIVNFGTPSSGKSNTKFMAYNNFFLGYGYIGLID